MIAATGLLPLPVFSLAPTATQCKYSASIARDGRKYKEKIQCGRRLSK
jgi:hypothetical protein